MEDPLYKPSEPLATEKVNHPAHYNASPSGVECIVVAEHMTFNLGNALKYIWRAGHKVSLLEDLKKARWYLDREIARTQKLDEQEATRAVAIMRNQYGEKK